MEWKQGETNVAAVVVVSAEVAGEPGFLNYAVFLSGKKLLRWVVIDESSRLHVKALETEGA
jgi:hypothetical protein